MLKAALSNKPLPYTKEELEELAGRCTGGEDEAKKVERQLTKSANAILMESKIGEKFEAIITGKTEHSKFIRVLYPPIEGKLMDADASLDVGDRVRVRLVHTDVEQGFIDFREV
jgi:exoribonuclease-2